MINHFIYSFQYEERFNGESRQLSATVIFCDLPQINEGALRSEIRAFYEKHYQTDKVFVVGASYLLDKMKEVFVDRQDETFIGIPKRHDTALRENLHLLTFDKDGKLTSVDNHPSDGFHARFIQEGLLQIFKQRGGLVSSEGTHHFVFPSGKHCDKFLRVGNILLYSCEINFIAFALLRHYDETRFDSIYCDTSSINSIALSLVRLKNWFLKTKDQKHVPIISFSSYQGLYNNDMSYAKSALLLISASTSANILTYIQKNHKIIDRENIIVLYFLGEDWSYLNIKDKTLCNLTESKTNPTGIPFYKTYKEQDCEHCKKGSFAVEVSGDVFLLENPKINPVLIEAKDAQVKLSGFVDQFKSRKESNSVLKVNYKENSDQKTKYEVYIDFYEILKGVQEGRFERFQEKLNHYINQFVPSNTRYIICLNDDASGQLSEYILDRIASNYREDQLPVIVSQDELSEKVNDIEGSVLVVGSCISNGKNLLYISRALRKHDKLRIVYFIGISRTKNENYLEQLQKNLKFGQYGGETYTFVTVESLCCHNDSKNSSWVSETRFLKDFIDFLKDHKPDAAKSIDWLTARKKLIEKSAGTEDRGLAEKLFYPRMQAGQEEQLKIRKNFAFFKFKNYVSHVTQSDIYFTISNILNSLRNSSDSSRNLRQTPYVRNLLDPANFSRFNDGIIQASILRSALPEELAYANSQELSQEMFGTLETLVRYHHGDQGEALLEFIYALATKKMSLKMIHLEGIVNLIDEKCQEDLITCFCLYMKEKLLKEEQQSALAQAAAIPQPLN